MTSALHSGTPFGRSKLTEVAGPEQHRRFPLSDIASVLVLLAALLVSTLALAPRAGAYVYWTTDTTIDHANLDGTGVNPSFLNAGEPKDVAVDANHIYWADYGSKGVGRANLDGSDVNQSFIGGAVDPYGVAVDANHIYWTNEATGTIGRANLDGSNVNQSFISGASGPWDVAVDAGHVYWTNSLGSAIGRANLDGSDVNQSFIGGATNPVGVSVDANYLYWANNGTATIGRAKLDGTEVNMSFISGANLPLGVAVDAGHIYWANWYPPTIGRANLDGTEVKLSFIGSGPYPGGVAVDALGPQPASITTTNPSDGLSGFSRTAPITVLFDQPMDKPSAEAAFSLKRTSNGDPLSGTFSWFANSVRFTPSSPLAAARVYTATVGTGARNLGGTHLSAPKVWKFTTTPQPLITFVYPVDGAAGIPRNAPVAVAFDTAMDKPSAQAAFSLRRTSNGAPVSGDFGWLGNALIFKPSSDLTAGVAYTARETNGAKNLDGRRVESGRTWVFSVAH